jgi:hypothetical protein
LTDRSIVGDLINFRGLVYSPLNENGVIFLFGKVVEDLNMYIEEIKPGFPDCIGRRFTGKGWERVRIEFEFSSSNFKSHKHDSKDCDVIICWEHDWKECPIEVIPLKEVIATLPNEPIERPDNQPEKGYSIEDLYKQKNVNEATKEIFINIDQKIRKIDEEIWTKVGKTTMVYYSPERVFVYTFFRKQSIRFEVFTRGQTIPGVTNFLYKRGGAKWGCINVGSNEEISAGIDAIKKSYALIKAAIKANEPTGWYATLDQDNDTDVEPEDAR